MLCTLCTKRGIPCIRSLTTTNSCDTCQQAHKKCLFVVRPFQPHGQRSSCARFPCEDSFVVNDDERNPEQEWTPGHQTGQWEKFQMISPVPSSIDLSTPPPKPPSKGHFTPRQERSDYPANEGWQWQEEIKAWANWHPWDSNAKRTYPAVSIQLSPEDVLTCQPEPEVAPTQSTEDPFGKSPLLFLDSYQLFLTPPLIISSSSRYSPLRNHHQRYGRQIPPPSTPTQVPSPEILASAPKNPTVSSALVPSSPHSHDDARQ
ncbi:hypothetical protein O181_060903 [Austropuccinia psidii MF-1]|uniref:Zn(2)-C6 fungal-type domain-containing protein n=1 Tax=Austropuccinia psidii MF-1 TaxID=1389203 RepID=A0A9Q3ELR0_9BASI|nr:hypothetical protein [Austropuccinia psidii MF-1]